MNHDKRLLDDPEVLFFQTSPFGNLDAIVQQNGQTVYFYLNERVGENQRSFFGTRACWVRNLVEGPLVFNMPEIDSGIPPVFPRTQTKHREGQPLPAPDSLHVVWFEEGNGAALIETDLETGNVQTIAVIPPWSGDNGFMGYSRECVVDSHFCSPLPDAGVLYDRIEKADSFWHDFVETPTPFATLQPKQLQAYRDHFGRLSGAVGPLQETQYFNINGDQFPPRGLVEFRLEESVYWLTTAMSIVPQPNVELSVEFPSAQRRIELAFQMDLAKASEATIERARNSMGALASIPWRQFNWLGKGHTCSFAVVEGFDVAVLIDDQTRVEVLNDAIEQQNDSGKLVQGIEMGSFREDPINLLWIVPISSMQMQQLENRECTVADIARHSRLSLPRK